MRNKILYINTENLKFFYRINKELSRLGIKFEILNVKDKLPNTPSIILTTTQELSKFKSLYKNLNFLPYSYEKDFQHYILKVIAAYRIEYKEFYSELLFSIDPGTKQIGIVLFLDDLFLMSHTIYDKSVFIEFIKDIVNCFQKDNPSLLKLDFKFGNGVLALTVELVKEIYNYFYDHQNMKICLIDESKSSKSKFKDKRRRVTTKHEVSALILSLRKGIEVDQSNYFKAFKPNKILELLNKEGKNNKDNEIEDDLSNLEPIINKLLNNEISLSESYEIVNTNAKIID
ncbi:MAG: hypothetical protein ACFE9Z_07570 [Promethearchaeota archaeon]